MDAKEALQLLEEAVSHWSENYEEAKTDIAFSLGEGHWDEEDIRARKARGCPSLVVNQLPQYIHQVANDIRQNTPSLNVLPGTDGDVKTAKVFKGLIRSIEQKSKADAAYDTAAECAVRSGFGFIRIDHDYCDDETDEQELQIKRVSNPLAVWLDPNSVECDGSDAEWAVALDTISKDKFEVAFPGREFVSFSKDAKPDTEQSITIAELFKKEYADAPGKGKRKLKKVTIRRYKFSGEGAPLEETTFPGKYIPVVPVYGEEIWKDGKRVLQSLIRQARDPQRRVNHWASKEQEILSLAPVAPVLAVEGTTEPYAEAWRSPGTATVLRYKQTDTEGNPAPRPERLAPPPIPTGIINAMQGAKENIKESMGLYNASIGQRSNETSGVAIDARKVEGEVATFHFGDNLKRSIEHVGRILVGAIPTIYDTPRIIQILNDENEPEMVGVNGAPLQDGQEEEFSLLTGKYDVRVTTGASYTTKRVEAAALLGEIIKGSPQNLMAFGDIWAKYLDVAGADALSARLRKMVPKELIADEEAKAKGEQPLDPEKEEMAQVIEALQAQLQQAMGTLEQAQMEAAKAETQAQADIAKAQVDMEKLRVDAMKVELEEKKLQMEAMKLLSAETTAPEQPVPPPTATPATAALPEIRLNTEGFQFVKTPEAEAAERAAAEQAAMQAELDRQLALSAQAEKAAQADAVIQMLGALAEQVAQLTSQVAQPRQVVRSPEGQIIGVQ